jgi:hypothetical protein
MPKKTKSPALGAGKSDMPVAKPVSAPKPAAIQKPGPQWAAKAGRGIAPVMKPLRLPGKGRGG